MMPDAKIPIWATAMQSYRFVLTHPRDLMRTGWLAVLALVVLTLALEPPTGESAAGYGLGPALLITAIDLGARAVIAVALLVAWHRLVMLESDAYGRRAPVRLGRRELRYLCAWFLLSVVFLAAFAAAMAMTVTVQFVAMLAVYGMLLLLGAADAIALGQRDQFLIGLYVSLLVAVPMASYLAVRLSLILPAMALDKDRPLRQAWRLSAGNGWRLVAASLIVMLPLEGLAVASAAAANALVATPFYPPMIVLNAACTVLLVVATGTVLSLFSLNLEAMARRADPLGADAVPAE